MPGPLPQHPTGRHTERRNRCVSAFILIINIYTIFFALNLVCRVLIAMSTADLFCAPRGLRALESGVSNASNTAITLYKNYYIIS